MSKIPPPPPGFVLDDDEDKPKATKAPPAKAAPPRKAAPPQPRPTAPSAASRVTTALQADGRARSASWGELTGNLIPSAVNAATGLYQMVRHPADTMEGLSDAGLGAVNRGVQAVFGRGLAPKRGETAAQAQTRAQGHEQAVQGVTSFYKGRYGSMADAKQTLITDPVGFALDATALAGGGSAALRAGRATAKAAPALVEAASRARVGAKVGGVRGAVRMALEPDPLTGSPAKWKPSAKPVKPVVSHADDAAIAALPEGFTLDTPGAPAGPRPMAAAPAAVPDVVAAAPTASVLDDAARAALPEGFTVDVPDGGAPIGAQPPQGLIVGAKMEGEIGSPVYAANAQIGPWQADGSNRSAMRGLDYNPVIGDSRFAGEDFRAAQAPFEANDARDYSIGMDAEGMPSLSAPAAPPVRPAALDRPNTPEHLQAAAQDVHPDQVVPIPGNVVGSPEELAAAQAGRYVPVKPYNERAELSRATLRGWKGQEVPKVGPIDMVGWLRLRGGIADQGGELSHMGMNNAARRGMDFVGQEARFGPLVDHAGMTLDDAARAAWDAGYFPELSDRPSVNEFLDALRETYDGRQRRFHPDDSEEISRFYAAQGERYDLEQQLREGPVFEDRSQPADAERPFAPVSAYEEWPSGGPDFAGNINLGKLETPQDIKRALDFTNRRVGFDAATRGRVTQAETERLASELGMTPDSLLARRKGQALNAEEALAARQILAKSANELVNAAKRVKALENPGDEALAAFRQAWVRHAALQEQVAGATAEAGRALAQFKMMANSRAVTGDVLSAMVQGGGGSGRLVDAANTLLDAVESGPGVFNSVVEKASKPRFRDKLTELYINSLLSGSQTHVVNVVSNTLTAMAQIPEFAAASVIGKGREMLARRELERVIGSEVGARAFGFVQGAKEGARLFAESIRTGEPSDFVSKVEGQHFKSISGIKGEVIRVPTRLLTAEDEFFKGVARRMELNAEAVRVARREGLKGEKAKARIADLVANPTDDMLEKSFEYARYLTFQRKLGPGMQKVAAMTGDWPILKLFIPFVRTPTNLLKFAVERSPAAPLLKEWRADFMAGGARRDVAVARAMLGTGFGMLIYDYAQRGMITGSVPSDPAKARLKYADGWQPYSVRVGDKWVSYKRLDPFSTTMGVAADMATLPEGMSEKQKQDKVTLLVASIMGNLADKTWLSGLSDVVGALSEPDRKADRLVQRLAGSIVVPTGVAQLARTIDPVQREAKTVPDYIQSRIPFASKSLLPRRDVWGNEVVNEGGLGPDILSPMWTSTARNDPVNRALLDSDISVGIPRDVVGKRKLTPEEHDRYKAEAGKAAHDALGPLVSGPGWQGLEPEDQEAMAKRVISGARKDVRDNLFGGGKGPAAPPAPPPPAGFRVEGESGGVNIYADLKQAIPGIGIQSGYRTPEYQDDMRRRGYHPATNSRHLDGSALDLTPPPGKSMAWLRGEVARLHPDAPMLDEGNHLHVIFPGYFGAPAIGGARSAGLKNPLEGMPPPPPGFSLDR